MMGKQYLKGLSLTPEQFKAAAERAVNVVVTAGAGSGKTRTLVARYVSLLADGLAPEAVLAITFTEKATREMRSRVRLELRRLALESQTEEERSFWQPLERRMEAARIVTIHSICAEIIRVNPAAAGVDPQFLVVDEGKTAIHRMDAVQQALAEASQDPSLSALFEIFKTQTLEKMLTQMLKTRLSLLKWQGQKEQDWQPIQAYLEGYIRDEEIQSAFRELSVLKQSGAVQADTTPNGVTKVESVLTDWQEVEQASQAHDTILCCQLLRTIRKGGLGGNLGRNNSQSKELLTMLRERYKENIEPWLGDDPLDETLEKAYQETIPLLKCLFDRAESVYRTLLDNEQSLDFDDLERMALSLLEQEQVASLWQSSIDAVLVDEFQDTNQRQRRIVEAICGAKAGKLFVVGDARQSIYRFRGADVTVFQQVQHTTEQAGGLRLELDSTFRTHAPLLAHLGALLKEMMGTASNPKRLFEVPFRPMRSQQTTPDWVIPPFLECHIGVGEDSETGRRAAAVKLVNRLVVLKAEGQIKNWQDVAVLFRTGKAFPVYEDCLEKAGIPYVTIAGDGFYDRPEIRDILNLMRALADPWDDLAMTGLLRSPAIGMSDLGIYQLRWGEGNEKVSLQKALEKQDWDKLSEIDRQAAVRAQGLLETIRPMMGRVPVVEVIQQVLSETCYRALLAGREERVWRNVDKLLQDQYATQLTSIHAYLEILERLKGTDAHEGEAPGEAGEAVQLMTVHKAKGLEFPVVVIADMGRMDYTFRGNWLPLGETSVACKGDNRAYEPLPFRLAKRLEEDQSKAEEKRLLYVAATRAQHRLILNGHCSQNEKSVKASGALKRVFDVLNLKPEDAVSHRSGQFVPLSDEFAVWLEASDQGWVHQVESLHPLLDPQQTEVTTLYPLLSAQKPLPTPQQERATEKISLLTDAAGKPTQRVLGKMLHRALQFWQFPSGIEEETFLHRAALEFGVLDPQSRQEAVRRVSAYLKNFKAHPLYADINRAPIRYHEIPYDVLQETTPDSGRLDILYQVEGEWRIVDFKTNSIPGHTGLLPQQAEQYGIQLSRYRQAVESQLLVKVQAQLCFFDYEGGLQLFDLKEEGLVAC